MVIDLTHSYMYMYIYIPEWLIHVTVGQQPNSEQNLPKAERFSERADTQWPAFHDPASAMKGVVKL